MRYDSTVGVSCCDIEKEEDNEKGTLFSFYFTLAYAYIAQNTFKISRIFTCSDCKM